MAIRYKEYIYYWQKEWFRLRLYCPGREYFQFFGYKLEMFIISGNLTILKKRARFNLQED